MKGSENYMRHRPYKSRKASRTVLIFVVILALISVIAVLMYKIGAFTTIGNFFSDKWNAFKEWITNASSEASESSASAVRIVMNSIR